MLAISKSSGLGIQRVQAPHFPMNRLKAHYDIEAKIAFDCAPADIRELAIELANFYEKEGEANFAVRGKIVDFLSSRNRAHDLSKAMFFIRNLVDLKKVQYQDGSGIEGVEKLFANAEQADMFGDNPSGFYFEAIVALSLLESGYQVKEFSVREIQNGKRMEKLRGSDGIEREIDIFATKDLGNEIVPIFIDAKSSLASMDKSQNKNHQIDALIEISDRYDAVPVFVLRTKDPILTPDGKLMDYEPLSFSNQTHNGFLRYLAEKNMLMWNEHGDELVPEKEVINYRRNYSIN